MAEWMGIREYARRRGVRHSSVQDAINSGRIAAAVRKDAQGNPRIDAEAADRLWDENTDPSEQRGAQAARDGSSDRAGARNRGPSYAEARAIRETFEARLSKIRYEKEVGELLPRAEIETSVHNIVHAARDKMLSLPDRLSPELASMTDEKLIHARLTKEIEAIQVELADDLAGVAHA